MPCKSKLVELNLAPMALRLLGLFLLFSVSIQAQAECRAYCLKLTPSGRDRAVSYEYVVKGPSFRSLMHICLSYEGNALFKSYKLGYAKTLASTSEPTSEALACPDLGRPPRRPPGLTPAERANLKADLVAKQKLKSGPNAAVEPVAQSAPPVDVDISKRVHPPANVTIQCAHPKAICPLDF